LSPLQVEPIAGTLTHMAPEVLRGELTSAQTDTWSLGIVLYETASGQLPFRGQSTLEISLAIMGSSPAPLKRTVPGKLKGIIRRCLEKNRAKRYASAREVLANLDAIRG
jgi:serine/threonine protein kinase